MERVPTEVQNPEHRRRMTGTLGCVLLLGALTECGRSVEGRGPNAAGAGGSEATAGEASVGMGDGAGAVDFLGGATSGGPPGGGSSGGLPSDHDAGRPIEFYACFHWSDLENQPIPGQRGSAACPRFSELRPTDAWRESFGACYWEPAVEEALVPPANDQQGDCCYGMAYLHCR